MPVESLNGATSNYMNAMQMRAANNEARSPGRAIRQLGQGLAGMKGAMDDATARAALRGELAKEGLDPGLADGDAHAAFSAIMDSRRSKLAAQQQAAQFEHADKSQAAQFGEQEKLRQMPTFGQTQDVEANKALAEASSQPMTDFSPAGSIKGALEGGVGHFAEKPPTDDVIDYRWQRSGKMPWQARMQKERIEARPGQKTPEQIAAEAKARAVGKAEGTPAAAPKGGDAPLTAQEAAQLGFPPEAVGMSRDVAKTKFTQGATTERTNIVQTGENERQGKSQMFTAGQKDKDRDLVKQRIDIMRHQVAMKLPGAVEKALTEINSQIIATFDPKRHAELEQDAKDLLAPYMPKSAPPTSPPSAEEIKQLDAEGLRYDPATGAVVPK